LSLPTTRSSCTHRTSRHAPFLSGTNALSAYAGSVANSRLYSPMKVSVSQWSAASTVSIPGQPELLRQPVLRRQERPLRAAAGVKK
jgi:hypothetical protein